MKELDSFTVEQLNDFIKSDHAQCGDVAALARIALAAKRADTAYWITYYPNPDPNEFDDKEHSHSGAKSCAIRIAREIGGFVVPVYYGVPLLNSPQGWIKCSDQMPEDSGRYWCYVEEQNCLGKSHYQWNCSWNGDMWSDWALTGRVTHWMPLPTPPEK